MKRVLSLAIILISILSLTAINVIAEDSFINKTVYYTSGAYHYILENGNAIITSYDGNEEVLIIPNIIDGYPVIELGKDSFCHSSNLKSVIVPEGILAIRGAAFESCRNLTSITLPNSLTIIEENVFMRCRSLISITIPNRVEVIESGTFGRCTSLTTVIIPDSVKEIDTLSFAGCTSLESIVIPGSVEKLGGAFHSCTALKSINIPENITQIDRATFYGCTSLTSIIIPENVESIDHGAFTKCENLETVIITNPNTVFEEGYKMDMVGELSPSFNECEKLSAIYSFSNSQAHTYAQNHQISFTPIVNVKLNGQKLKFDSPPIIENGRVLVPMRTVFEAFGADIGWNEEAAAVTATTANKSIALQIGSNQMTVNGEAITLDVPPQLNMARTLVPLRAIGEALDADVHWDEDTQTVLISF